MLRVTVALENGRDIQFPETMLDCPHCGKFIKFYSICPRVCNNCLKGIPDVKAMRRLKVARRHYYIGGFDD